MIEVIVTRHPALVKYLQEIGMVEGEIEVLSHATPEAVRGRHVLGVLPHSLSCLCASFTEVPLMLPAELRGTELSVEQIRQFVGEPVTYMVQASCPSCGASLTNNPACIEHEGVH